MFQNTRVDVFWRTWRISYVKLFILWIFYNFDLCKFKTDKYTLFMQNQMAQKNMEQSLIWVNKNASEAY